MPDKTNLGLLLVASTLLLFITLSSGCEDLDEQLCNQIEDKYPGLCNDTCLSKMCQRRCGMCPVKCYQCHEIDNPKNCSTSVECPTKDHYCYTTQSFTDDFIEIYKLGCATKAICKDYFGDRIGRGLRIEATCCENDNCNNMTPEEIENEKYTNSIIHKHDKHPVNITAPNLIENCRNIEENICTRLGILDPDFCLNNTCAATKLCPRMCRKCCKLLHGIFHICPGINPRLPYQARGRSPRADMSRGLTPGQIWKIPVNCYTCNDIDRAEDCNITSTCADGKSCFSLETISADFRPVYRLGCMDMSLCQRFQTSSAIFGKREDIQLKGGCCTTDRCNGKMSPTTTAATEATTTTYVQACHQQSATSCQSGGVRYNNYCYYLGSTAVTWIQAKAYCQTKCAHLADFVSDTELSTVLTHLHVHYIAHNRFRGGPVWTDAVRSGRNWIWETTATSINPVFMQHLSHTLNCAATHESRKTTILESTACTNKIKPLCKSF